MRDWAATGCASTTPSSTAAVPAAIRRQVLEDCPGAREIGDRGEAIMRAVQALVPGDVLVVAGKGHETTQEFDDHTIEFDDRAVARECLEARS